MKNLLEKGKTSEFKGVKNNEGAIVTAPLVFENFKVNVG
jgi:DNA topoisomerase-3